MQLICAAGAQRLRRLAEGLRNSRSPTQRIGLRVVERIVAALEARLGALSLFTLALTAERLGLLPGPKQVIRAKHEAPRDPAFVRKQWPVKRPQMPAQCREVTDSNRIIIRFCPCSPV